MTKSQKFPLRWGKNQGKTSILDVSEQFRTTNFRFSNWKILLRNKRSCSLRCRVSHRYRNASLLFTTFIYKLHRRGFRRFQGRGIALLPFGKSIYKLHRRGARCFREGKIAPLPFAKTIYKLHIYAVPNVFTGVGTHLYHSQKLFTGCRNAPLLFVK